MSQCPLIFHVILGQHILLVGDVGQNMSKPILFSRLCQMGLDELDQTHISAMLTKAVSRDPKEMLLTHLSRSKHAICLSWSFHLHWKYIVRFICNLNKFFVGPSCILSLLGRVFWDKKLPNQLLESFHHRPV